MSKCYWFWSLFLLVGVALVCISVGSVNISLSTTLTSLHHLLAAIEPTGSDQQIIMNLRTPRVLSAALVGICLSLSGATMQGLLKNPMADGSTLGVSAGGALGAVVAIITGFSLPAFPFSGLVILSIIFSFLSMLFILWAAYCLGSRFSNVSLILMGMVFSMFINSIISLLLVFFQEKLEQIIFWTMGSLSGTSYHDVFMLAVVVLVFGGLIALHAEEVNALALGEDHARNLGVDVGKVRLLLIISVAALVGTSVAISGTIGFVGLVVPHMARMLVGPNHKRLFPMSAIFGAIFLMVTDLLARTLASPIELPIGVITSFIGALVFVFIFNQQKRGG